MIADNNFNESVATANQVAHLQDKGQFKQIINKLKGSLANLEPTQLVTLLQSCELVQLKDDDLIASLLTHLQKLTYD